MDKTNQSELARRYSRMWAVSMMLLYAAALLVYDLLEETFETPLYLLVSAVSCLAGCVLVTGIMVNQDGHNYNKRTNK